MRIDKENSDDTTIKVSFHLWKDKMFPLTGEQLEYMAPLTQGELSSTFVTPSVCVHNTGLKHC